MAELLKGYAQYLEVKYPAHFGNFKEENRQRGFLVFTPKLSMFLC